MNKYEFIENKIKEVKKELKERKAWRKALVDEYCKERTQKSEITKKQVLDMIEIAKVIVRHNEKILLEYETMLEECKKIEK